MSLNDDKMITSSIFKGGKGNYKITILPIIIKIFYNDIKITSACQYFVQNSMMKMDRIILVKNNNIINKNRPMSVYKIETNNSYNHIFYYSSENYKTSKISDKNSFIIPGLYINSFYISNRSIKIYDYASAYLIYQFDKKDDPFLRFVSFEEYLLNS